jgi:hypothetical protein
MLRSADELLETADPAWPLLLREIAAAGSSARLLPGGGVAGRRELEALQVTARSSLGACAYHMGGLLIDAGWLCVLGCGHEDGVWSITMATGHAQFGHREGSPEGLVVGVDVLGGLFAVNGGFLSAVPVGRVAYFGPDTLRWEDTGGGHGAWMESMLDAAFRSEFYRDLRWKGWEQEVAALRPGTGIAIYPPLYTRESRPLEATRRTVVPLGELVACSLDVGRQLDD